MSFLILLILNSLVINKIIKLLLSILQSKLTFYNLNTSIMNYLLICFILLTSNVSYENPELTIQIENIGILEGRIRIGVFNKGENFLKREAAIKHYYITVKSSTEIIKINDLPKGDYAFSMFHDENSDDEFNLNFLGIPKEPYGFSNNVKPKFSAPSYESCKFSLAEDRTVEVTLSN